MERVSKVLCPVDGSATSQRATDFAIDIASKYGAKMDVIHVVPIGEFVRALGVVGPTYPEMMEKQVESAREESGRSLDAIRASAKKLGVDAHTEVLVSTSSISKTIVDFAEREHVDLIVMGTRGETDVGKLIVGSTAAGVMNGCKCAITIIK